MLKRTYLKKPDWLKMRLPSGKEFREVFDLLKHYDLFTVCQEARCPNMAECWGRKSATIMILGKVCTRACRFCAVSTGKPGGALDNDEPQNVASAVHDLGLRYVVITSVDRDDLPDLGSSHYARTIEEIRKKNPETKVEVLIPDFGGERKYLEKIAAAEPHVIGHNIETVRSLTPSIRDRRCGYDTSLGVLKIVKKIEPRMMTKSGFMLGLGETDVEIRQALEDLRNTSVDIVTIGQYLQPTRRHAQVIKYYSPEEFANFGKIGEAIGIKGLLSGPLVRSSYHADGLYDKMVTADVDLQAR